MIIILALLLIVVVVNSDSSFGSGSSAVQQGPFFTPCTFPTPHQSTHYHLFCDGHHRRLPYICDLHRLISPAGVQTISLAFAKYRHYFMFNQSLSIGVVLVRQLAPPPTEAHVYSNRLEYGCLFGAGDDELDGCVRMDVQTVSRFVHRWKSYTNIYASILYERWFRVRPPTSLCQLQQPNILMLVAVDGLLNDPRMHPIIRLHSGKCQSMSNYFVLQPNRVYQLRSQMCNSNQSTQFFKAYRCIASSKIYYCKSATCWPNSIQLAVCRVAISYLYGHSKSSASVYCSSSPPSCSNTTSSDASSQSRHHRQAWSCPVLDPKHTSCSDNDHNNITKHCLPNVITIV